MAQIGTFKSNGVATPAASKALTLKANLTLEPSLQKRESPDSGSSAR